MKKLKNHLLLSLTGNSFKGSVSKFKSSIFAIVFGLLIGTIPIIISGGNPIGGYIEMFTSPFDSFNLRRTILFVSIFILLGSGIGISFKTGLFNIGATGQMMAGGAATVVLGILFEWDKSFSLVLLLLVAMIVGALMALIPAVLKAFFNVHEVVSTILLNWIIFFIVKFISKLPGIVSPDGIGSKSINESMAFSIAIDSNDFIYILIIGVLFALILFFVLRFTTIGYKLRLNGLNQNAAQYSGINSKNNIIISMLISGAFAGIAGFFFYNTFSGKIPYLDFRLPNVAFEAITVALLGFSSPIGTIFSGFFYGVIYIGSEGIAAGSGGSVTQETAELTIAILIFTSALIMSFIKIQPIYWLKKKIYLHKSFKTKQYRQMRKKDLFDLKAQKQSKINLLKPIVITNKVALKKIQHSWLIQKNELKKRLNNNLISQDEFDLKSKKIDQEFNDKKEVQLFNEYNKINKVFKIEKRNLKNKYKLLIDNSLNEYLDKINKNKETKNHLLLELSKKNLSKDKLAIQMHQIKANYSQDKLILKQQWKGRK